MGAVYEALHRDLKKRVAIKTLHSAVAAMPAARARFLREGEAASRIRHPNIVDVTDVATEDGIPYLVMELLEGEDLAARLERSPGPSFSESADILLPVFAAISVAHDEGVIHRDLKPANIFLTRTRRGGFEPKVLDFGISKLRPRGDGNTLALTGSDASMGTPCYVAPEQVRSAAGVDARSDQYALGAILYECVTGQRAHQGENIYDVIRSVGEGSFPPPAAIRADIPSELDAAILRAMQLEPARRFKSIQAFGRAILPFASPAVRQQLAPAFTGDGRGDPRTTSEIWASPGGTVVFSTPPPSNPGSDAWASRSRLTPPASTTFGSSAAQLTPTARRRPGWLVGGFVVLVGVGVAAYALTLPTRRRRNDRWREPAAGAVETPPAAATKPPGRYHVAVTANPPEAQIDLDGAPAGTGRIDEELPIDGAEHVLSVTARGFRPAKLTFRDRPPPDDVTLEPVPVSSPPGRAVVRRPSEQPARAHSHGAHHREKLPATTSAKPAGPTRTENNAPIIDD
jgi:serine/threonine protein kinase